MMNRFSCLVPLVLLLSFSAHAIPQSEPNRAGSVVVRPRIGNSLPGGPGLVEFNDVKRPGVALVLSGGGARGLSSIGVLKVFEENAIPIDLIVGTSIGSIVGGLYASGYSPADLEHIALTTDWGEVLSYDDDARRRDMFLDQKLATEKSILVLRFDGFEPVLPAAYSTGQRLTNFLNLLVLQSIYRPDPGFDALRVPFRAVTTDLISGRQFVYREGDLSEALRAAVSVPLLFSSVKKDSMQLMDGGLISNMPVDVALDEGMDCIIIVDVTSPLRTAGEVVAPWEVGEQIMGIMMQRSNAEAREKADVVITPPLGDHLSSDFTHIEDLIAYGEDAAYGALERIRAQLQVPMNQVNGTQYDHLRIDLSDADLAAGDAAFIEDQLASLVVNRQDIQVVVDQLHSSGMYKELSVQIEVDSSGARSNWKAVRYPVLHTVEFKGVASLPVDSLVAQFSRLLGRPLNARTSHAAIERVLGLYRTRGYSLAHIERTTFDPATGNAVLEVDEGRISRMTIKGTEKTKDYVVWRELPFGEGDVFQVSSVAEGISNIYSTNLFEQAAVEIEHEGTQNQNHVIIFNLRERATDLMRVGLKVDNERSFQPWLNVSDENFFGAGAEIGVSFAGGTRNQAIVGELMASRIFDSYLTSRLRLYMRSRDINTYDNVLGLSNNRFERTRVGEIREIRRGGSLSFGAQLERLGDVTVEGRLERIQVYNIVNQPITNQDYDISSVLFGTRIDTQDKIPYPTDGVNLNFAYETAITRSSTSVGFTKFLFSYESYKTLGQRHTISTRLMLGLGDDAVPTSEQFSLGGQQSFLGYREDNARGRQIFVGGVEYRYLLPIRIYFDTYISLKYDIGSVWLRSEEIRLVDLQHGIGVSLGFDTPIGPAQFSLGRSFITRGDLSNQPLALGPVLAYFSLGYTIE